MSEDDDVIEIDVTGIVNIDISNEEKAKEGIAKKGGKKERENGNALYQSWKERLKKIPKLAEKHYNQRKETRKERDYRENFRP